MSIWVLILTETEIVDSGKHSYHYCHNNGFYHASCHFLHQQERHNKCYDTEYIISKIFHHTFFLLLFLPFTFHLFYLLTTCLNAAGIMVWNSIGCPVTG